LFDDTFGGIIVPAATPGGSPLVHLLKEVCHRDRRFKVQATALSRFATRCFAYRQPCELQRELPLPCGASSTTPALRAFVAFVQEVLRRIRSLLQIVGHDFAFLV